MEFGIVSRMTQGLFRYQGWPTVARDDRGTLYAAASGHRLGHVCPFGKNLLYVSHDQGSTWSAPQIINDTFLDDRDAGLCAWGSGNLMLTWFNLPPAPMYEREGQYPSLANPLARGAQEYWKQLPAEDLIPGSFCRVSHDGGNTWSEIRKAPVTAPHGPTVTPEGKLFYLGKEFFSGDPSLKEDHIYAFQSRDEGRTWEKLCQIPLPGEWTVSVLHEPHAVCLPDGTILGGLRITSDKLPGDRDGIFTTISCDGGKTFSPPQLLDVSGTPPHFLLHSSGAVVLVYGRRAKPCGQRARISYDGGSTWSAEIVISPEAPTWDHGYPSSVELSDGSILTVYYQRYENDDYNSVLYTKWELPRED